MFLKCENLFPIGSFKLRGAGNALLMADPAELQQGVVTASAGNMAQGVAWWTRRLGLRCTAIVPDYAPAAKLGPFERMGGRVVRVPFDEWWQTLTDRGHPDVTGFFLHPVADSNVVAGNGTLGLELLDTLPDVDTVLVPFGGGGLASGIAVALDGKARVVGCEVETAAPLRASLEAKKPVSVEHQPSWVDGIGGGGLLPEMWPLVEARVPEALVSSLEEIGGAIRYLFARNQLVAEGAGAASLAPVLQRRVRGGQMVCIVSGGNIDPELFARILKGG